MPSWADATDDEPWPTPPVVVPPEVKEKPHK